MKTTWECSFCGVEEPCTYTLADDSLGPPHCCPWDGVSGWVRVESEDDDVEE